MSVRTWNLGEGLDGWEVWASPAPRPAVWKGRSAIRLEDGWLLRPEPVTANSFVLEADVAFEGAGGFAGIAFGADAPGNGAVPGAACPNGTHGSDGAAYPQDHELIYVCPDRQGEEGEIQYEPQLRGSGSWQIYHGDRYQGRAPVRPGEWVRLRIDIAPGRAAVRVGETPTPQLVTPLMLGRTTGRMGVWGYKACYIARLTWRPAEEPIPLVAPAAPLPDTVITEWQVARHRDAGTWLPARVEENGTLNLNRLFDYAVGATAYARCEFRAAAACEAALSLGFSDRLRLWVNDEILHEGRWGWNPPEADGRIRSDHTRLAARLCPGPNRILAEIAADEPFGWGLALRVQPAGATSSRGLSRR